MIIVQGLGAPRRGRGRGRRRGGGGGGFIPVSVGVDPYVDLVAQGYKPLPPPPPPFTAERGESVLGRFTDLKSAIELAKSASKDGAEVVVKATGNVLGGYRNGKRTFTTLDGAQLGIPAYTNPLSPFSGGLGYYNYRAWHGGINDALPALEPMRKRKIVGGTRPAELPQHHKQVIDDLSAFLRQKILELDATGAQPSAPLTMRGFMGLGQPAQGVERLDTVTFRLPHGALQTVQRLIGQVAAFANNVRNDPQIRAIAAQTAHRAASIVRQGAPLMRRTG